MINNETPTPADALLHAFRTFLGMPADTDTPPACGAEITRNYGRIPKTGRCAECDRLVAEARAKEARANRLLAATIFPERFKA